MENATAEMEMNKRDNHEAIERRLLQRRSDVRAMLRSQESFTPADHSVGDFADIATDTEQDDVQIHSAAEGFHELEQIADALKRIRNGTYGLCQECEQPILRERLKALPYVTLCINCRRTTEHRK
jgi:DnaK suppressor protein